MKLYVVGGSIRDILLGKAPKDLDYVVVGSNHDEMISLGFTRVGSGFPVYLHPDTSDEYALARTERKVGVGYNGFECNTEYVSLYDDLSRRDLTINSLAVPVEHFQEFCDTKDTNVIIDYFGGITDLRNGLLQHINKDFGLDPIRVLRTARFAARYGFTVSVNTLMLMNLIASELNHVPTERIWAEMFKGLNEHYADKMFDVLNVAWVFNVDIMRPYKQVDYGSMVNNRDADVITKFCMAAIGFNKDDYHNMSIPNDFALISHAYNERKHDLQNYSKKTASERLDILTKLRAFNNNDMVESVLKVFVKCSPTYGQFIADMVWHDIEQVRTVDAAEISKQFKTGEEIKRAIYSARLSKLI